MFDGLSERLGQTVRNLRGVGRLTEENIKETLREVRMALLEADVALPVVKEFTDHVREKALGEDVLKSLTPGQALIKIVNDELVALMGEANDSLDLSVTPPAVILLAGLQGSGKTTSAGKLARWLQENQKKSVMLVSTDIYRPAAIDQLQTVAGQVEASFCPSASDEDPVEIARRALEQAKVQHKDVLIVDTAGRLHIDETMMDEVRRLHETVQPVETLFVVDSMTGQDAANTARVFHEALPLTGVILTKTDGDARGGAALSIRQITGKPIKFLGTGEKTTALEPFHPDRVASRILGMGDVVSLVEEAQGKIDLDEAEKMAAKLKKGKGFDLEDFLAQFQQMKKMGGLASMMDKLPGMPNVPAGALDATAGEQQIKRMEAIIRSMTPAERRKPDLIKGSRKRRIAGGSGTQIQDVNRLLKQFTQMQKMMKKMKGGGMAKMMRGLKGGNLPPGLM
ncbi:signal recognition particle protein [Thiohalophilus sp.]|uniref:signal recognition particle protein n=1 Tax=Thiohalophilus sp. TaxID=3028392 RepID=UPI002ACE1D1B|nr:signal recognition particle protein [Thiohalophilus sp.]MDZ7802566.1 signal recognition particle protein [Thiohalophilus sp.]